MTSTHQRSSTLTSAAATFIVGVLLWVSGAFTLIVDWGGHSAAVRAAILIAAFIIQVIAPKRPALAMCAIVALIAVDIPSGLSLPLWISLTDVIFAVMTAGSARVRRIVGTTCFAVTFGCAVVVAIAIDPRAGVLAGLLGVAFLVSPLGYAQSVQATKRAAEAENVAAEAEHAAALAQERRRVSRELHDTVAGHVSAIAILAEAARDADDPAPVIASMRSNSLAALAELRAMIDVLASDGDEAATVRWSSLEPLVAAARSVGSPVSIGTAHGLTVTAETVVTRIAAEALTNATRHAPGHPIVIALDVDSDAVELTVTNETDQTIREPSDGKGLRNMRIRAESIDGTLSAGPDGHRWVVHARIPTVHV